MDIRKNVAVAACTIALLSFPGAFATGADDMPVVTDQPYTDAQQMPTVTDIPYTEEEIAQNEARAEEQIRDIQQRLIDLGYLTGKADGLIGPRTQASLELYQKLRGLPVTGEPDAATTDALSSEDQRVLPAALSMGDKGEAVTALQEQLTRFGFMVGKADGEYGKVTRSAVERFQEHLISQGVDAELGIEATGEATPMTLALLMDADYSSYLTDVALGDEGVEAQRLERRLKALNYMDGEPDEVFDDYAMECALAFKEKAGLEGERLDKAFVDALFAEDAPLAEHFVLHDIAYADKGIAVREARESLVWAGMTVQMPGASYDDSTVEALERVYDYLQTIGSDKASLFEDPTRLNVAAQQILREGLPVANDEGLDEEDEVRPLQRRLHTLFYLSKQNVDGKAGEATRGAVEAFQQTNGLPVTGEADALTREVLFSSHAVSKAYPFRVEVDIDSQRVYVYQLRENGEYEQVQTFICSTGVGEATPRGIYLDGFPVSTWHHFEKFDCWARYTFEIEGDIMFHSVLYSEKDTDTLRYGSVYALGSKASHGCIRLKVSDAKWLFENCKRGSLVIVIY